MSEHLSGYIQNILLFRKILKYAKKQDKYDKAEYIKTDLKFAANIKG